MKKDIKYSWPVAGGLIAGGLSSIFYTHTSYWLFWFGGAAGYTLFYFLYKNK